MARHTPHTAADIMTTEIVSVEEDQSVSSTGELLEVLRFRHMPVTDGDRLVGLVTQRDVLRVSASTAAPNQAAQNQFLSGTLRVKDVMTTELSTAKPTTPLREIAQLMQENKLGCVPVVEGENTLVGLITEADFVALAAKLLSNT